MFGGPSRGRDGLAFADRYPGESAVDAGASAEVGQGEGERVAFQVRSDGFPFGFVEVLRTEEEEYRAIGETDVSGVGQPMDIGPGKRGCDLRRRLRARVLPLLHEAMAGIVLDAERELQAGLLELRDEEPGIAVDHRVVVEALRAVPVDDRAVDAGGLHEGDLSGDDAGVAGVVGAEGGLVVCRQHALVRVGLVHRPMPTPASAGGLAFEPGHHVHQDQRPWRAGRLRGGLGRQPSRHHQKQECLEAHGVSTPPRLDPFNPQAGDPEDIEISPGSLNWSGRRDLNSQPLLPESSALPD